MALKQSEFQTIILFLFYLIPSTEQRYAKQCPFAWENIDGYCFKYKKEPIFWGAAANYCTSEKDMYTYAMLYEPRDENTKTALINYMNTKDQKGAIHLGLKNIKGDGNVSEYYYVSDDQQTFINSSLIDKTSDDKCFEVIYDPKDEIITCDDMIKVMATALKNDNFPGIPRGTVCMMDPDWFRSCDSFTSQSSPCQSGAVCSENVNTGWSCTCSTGYQNLKYDEDNQRATCNPVPTSATTKKTTDDFYNSKDVNKVPKETDHREEDSEADYTVIFIVLGLLFLFGVLGLVGFLVKKKKEKGKKQENDEDHEEEGIKASSAAEASAAEASATGASVSAAVTSSAVASSFPASKGSVNSEMMNDEVLDSTNKQSTQVI